MNKSLIADWVAWADGVEQLRGCGRRGVRDHQRGVQGCRERARAGGSAAHQAPAFKAGMVLREAASGKGGQGALRGAQGAVYPARAEVIGGA